MKFMAGKNERTPRKTCSRLLFVHHETHMGVKRDANSGPQRWEESVLITLKWNGPSLCNIMLTRRVHGDRVTDLFKLCEIEVSLCNKEMTKVYDPLFRNTRGNRVNIREDICSVSYSLFCAAIQKVQCGRAVIDAVLLVVTSVVRILLLDLFL